MLEDERGRTSFGSDARVFMLVMTCVEAICEIKTREWSFPNCSVVWVRRVPAPVQFGAQTSLNSRPFSPLASQASMKR
jgi:hypothetical protein